MDTKEFLDKVEVALNQPPGSLNVQTVLRELDGWDSIGALGVIAVVDESYGVTLDADAMWRCRTVGELQELVRSGLRTS